MDSPQNKDSLYDPDYVRGLEDKIEMMSVFINSSEAGMYVADYYTGEILFANSKMLSLGGNKMEIGSLIGKTCWKVINSEIGTRCGFCPHNRLLDDKGCPTNPYIWEQYFDKYAFWLKIISQVITWTDGRLVQMNTFYDITETKQLQERLLQLAYTDQLLQIKNGFRFEYDIKEAAVVPSVIIFDILSLQRVNDAYGRAIGDALLKAVRNWILEMGIPSAELYRVGGDEFCLSVWQSDVEVIKKIANDISERFTKPWKIEENGSTVQVYTNVSIGVILSDYVNSGESQLNLMERTLKSAKNSGKTIIYDEAMNKIFQNQLVMEMSMKKSVRENMSDFDVYFQPIINHNREWVGLEALCRWSSATLGFVPPSVFIPEAERLLLIGKMGLWVLEKAIGKCKELKLDKMPDFRLNVNVSSLQFDDELLAARFFEVLRNYNYPYGCLCIEITESTQFSFTELASSTINSLRDAGVLVALDDFGTGYSNFNNLKKLPVDIVKIERAFISDIIDNDYHQYLFRAMTELAHTAGKKVIAEGVENEKQAKALIDGGADYLQGYLFGKPLTSVELEHKAKEYLKGINKCGYKNTILKWIPRYKGDV